MSATANFLRRWTKRPTTQDDIRSDMDRHRVRPLLLELEDRTLPTAGGLDPTFGTGGIAVTDFGANENAEGVAVQLDGKIVVAGHNGRDFLLARYNSSGGLDTSFGQGGRVVTDFGSDNDGASDVALQSDGKIVVAGWTFAGGGGSNYAVARYNIDGTLDLGFGSGGKVVTDFLGFSDRAYELAIQPDGKIVVAGNAVRAPTAGQGIGLVRYNPDGTLDAGFGVAGRVTTFFSSDNGNECHAVALQADGKIVAGGWAVVGGQVDLALARYTAGGNLDASFGQGGLVATPVQDYAEVDSIAVQPDGRIVAAGFAAQSAGMALVRYNPNGGPDTTFGVQGQVFVDFASYHSRTWGVAIQADGRILAAGSTVLLTNAGVVDFALVRLNANGALDLTFGTGGKVTTSIGPNGDEALCVALQPDGKIVTVGDTYNGRDNDFALARYDGGTLSPSATFRDESRTNQAESLYGVNGRGVTVAILDRGIDYTHPDFRKPDGSTRIKWILDMGGQNPQPVEYNEAQINAALFGGPPLSTRDAVGHGTPTAGLAAGNGSAAANGFYRGMAPNADLIIIKITSEGAPAHDGQPAEIPFQGNIDQALSWLDQKITLLNQPCVAIINSGVQWGPIDGTSAVSHKIDQVFGLDHPGRAFVAPSGDEGNLDNHAGGSYGDSGDGVIRFNNTASTPVYVQLWYTGSRPAQITVSCDDGTSTGPVNPNGNVTVGGIEVAHYLPGTEFYPWTSTSGDRAVWIRITGHTGGGTIRIHGTTGGTGRYDIYAPGVPPPLTFNDHIVPGRLTDYAATTSAIVAGAHVLQTTYTDIDGVPRDLGSGEGVPGGLWRYSSGGPSRDNRPVVVALTASGQNAFAAYAANSYWATFRFNMVYDGGGSYGRAGATSASGPIVTGASALLLQVAPELTARDVQQILQQTARADSFTGTVPNSNWGYGKLDVRAAVEAARLLRVDVSTGTVSEAAGAGAATVTITRRGVDVSTALTVTLSSSDPTEATLPSTVIIPANQRSVTVPLTAVDDNDLDGDQVVTVTANAGNYFTYPGKVIVTDNESSLQPIATGTAGVFTLNGGATVVNGRLRLTDGGSYQLRSVFSSTPQAIGRFSTTFSFQLTNPGADGFTFTIQGNGPGALGFAGGGLGYGSDSPNGPVGIPKSLAVKFDLNDNVGEGNNSTGVYTNGASPTIPATALGQAIDLHSGHVMRATISYEGSNLTLVLTDTVTSQTFTKTYAGYNIPALVGGPTAYVGFTAATGGLTATQDILSWAFTPTPPATVQAVTVSGGSAQRSRVTDLTVTFSSLVSLPTSAATAFRLTRLGPSGPTGDVTLAVDLSGSTAAQTVARLTFSGGLTESGSLIDGNYSLTVLGSQVTGNGQPLDGDGDGVPGGNYTDSIFRLFGDVNGDRFVNGADFALFRAAFGSARGSPAYVDHLDFDGDGFINGTDFAQFRTRFGYSLP